MKIRINNNNNNKYCNCCHPIDFGTCETNYSKRPRHVAAPHLQMTSRPSTPPT